MNSEKQYIVGLVRDGDLDLDRFISGIDEVERLLGKNYVFHDAEVDDIHILRKEEVVVIHTWVGYAVDPSKCYDVTWRLENCINLNLEDYEMKGVSPFVWDVGFEYEPIYPDRITIYFNTAGIRAVCRHITISVGEVEEGTDA